jgi:hypothetical protein
MPLRGCKDSNNWSYFAFSAGFTAQSLDSKELLIVGGDIRLL